MEKMDTTAEDILKGLGTGFGLFAAELSGIGIFLIGETVIPGIWMLFLTLTVWLLGLGQSAAFGYKHSDSEFFMGGYCVGASFAMFLAAVLSDPIFIPVVGGIFWTAIGAIIGMLLKLFEQ